MIVHGFCSGFSRLSLRDDDDDDDDDKDKDDDGDDDGVQYVNKGCKQYLPMSSQIGVDPGIKVKRIKLA